MQPEAVRRVAATVPYLFRELNVDDQGRTRYTVMTGQSLQLSFFEGNAGTTDMCRSRGEGDVEDTVQPCERDRLRT